MDYVSKGANGSVKVHFDQNGGASMHDLWAYLSRVYILY